MSAILPTSHASVPATSIGSDPPRNRSGRILRKRVKTGCLTCRKRRIKCGEQRPSCYNCIKSKRDCDYNSRHEFRNHLPALGEAASSEFVSGFSAPFVSAGRLPGPFQQSPWPSNGPPPTPQTPSYPRQYPQSMSTPYTPTPVGVPQNPFSFHPTTGTIYPSPTVTNTPSFPNFQRSGHPDDFIGSTPTFPSFPAHTMSSQSPVTPAFEPQWPGNPLAFSGTRVDSTMAQSLPQSMSTAMISSSEPQSQAYTTDHGSSIKRQRLDGLSYEVQAASSASGDGILYTSAPTNPPLYNHPDSETLLELAAVEIEDDDYFDVLPEEEDSYPTVTEARSVLPSIESFSNGIGPASSGTVGIYNESYAASPLKNQATQMVFRHFIWHTAPILSIFERPSNLQAAIGPPPGMNGSPLSCWMDSLPKMAIHDPGLLHAMLAHSSYGMAKSQGASTTPSGKHYAWSLRRVHRALDAPRKRHHITTLAATLLLGYYEILTADHLKWSTHLSGARGLIMESNFKGMTNEVRRRLRMSNTVGLVEPDQSLVETLMGFKLLDNSENGSQQPLPFSARVDLSLYPVQQDLFWWFCKQDAYHSIIGGNDLLLPYHRWADCPPRAPIGDPNAVYGSHDYLMLLLGRVATFATNDRPRKIRVNKMPPPPSTPGQQPPTPVTPKQPSPVFYGMAPGGGKPRLPRAYGTEVIETISKDKYLHSSPEELEAATQQAEQEWNDIDQACNIFADRLQVGGEFGPLEQHEKPSYQTPFGPSVHFRSYEIASLWLVYYLVVLVHIRGHPSKPAAAHVSVGVSAKQTSWVANEIGKIAAGMTPPGTHSEHHFKFLGAYTASTVPLFFAAVQFQDFSQRFWVIHRLLDIAKTCGWSTAETCANGCEVAWMRAASMGRGPTWERISRELSSPEQQMSLQYMRQRGANPAAVSEQMANMSLRDDTDS